MYFEDITFRVKTVVVTFVGKFRKNGLLFIHYLVTLVEAQLIRLEVLVLIRNVYGRSTLARKQGSQCST